MNGRQRSSPGDQKLERNYLLRLAALESARIIDEQATEAHQTLDRNFSAASALSLIYGHCQALRL